MRLLTRLSALVAAVVVTLTAAPAMANTYSHADAWADGIVDSCDMSTFDCTTTPEPGRASGDIKRIAVDHRRKAVIVRTRYRALDRDADMRLEVVSLVTNEGLRRDVMVMIGLKRVEMTKRTGEPIKCRGLSQDIDREAATIKVVVPTSCLSSPRWIQAGVGYASLSLGGEDEQIAVFQDDALLDGRVNQFRLALTKRIHRA